METPVKILEPTKVIRIHRSAALVVAVLALGACSLLQPKPADQVSDADVNLNSSWHANIASPPDLAGAVQMSGSASMAPGTKRGTTEIVMKLGNSSPGGVHPWAIHLGQCGADQGVFGALDNYSPLSVNSNGTGVSSATVGLDTPAAGNYFVSVQASAANRDLTVGCGNLAAPTT
jgi:hypothetical protein